VSAYVTLSQRAEALSSDEVRKILPEDLSTFSLVQKAGLRYPAMSRPAPSLWQNLAFDWSFPEISSVDNLIESYSCALERYGIKIRGRLYVAETYVCFYSPFLQLINQIVLPVFAIEEPQKEWTAGILPNAIRITTPNANHRFTSFTSFGWRDTAFDVIYSLWVERKRMAMFLLDEEKAT